MTEQQLDDFLKNNFHAVNEEFLDEKGLRIYRVDLKALADFWRKKLENDDLTGDFERQTAEKVISKAENSEDENPIFAIIHAESFPLLVEMKTGVQLGKTLREKESAVPSKIMSEKDWTKIIGFGQFSAEDVKDFLRYSYRLASE